MPIRLRLKYVLICRAREWNQWAMQMENLALTNISQMYNTYEMESLFYNQHINVPCVGLVILPVALWFRHCTLWSMTDLQYIEVCQSCSGPYQVAWCPEKRPAMKIIPRPCVSILTSEMSDLVHKIKKCKHFSTKYDLGPQIEKCKQFRKNEIWG